MATDHEREDVSPMDEAILLDPLEHVVTLNGHGTFAHDTFVAPEAVFVLAPHPEGFDQPYGLGSPPNDVSFEEMIFVNGPDRFPVPSSDGWRLYRPMDAIPNVVLGPWSGSKDRDEEHARWLDRVPAADADYVRRDEEGRLPAFATVPARTSTGDVATYRGRPRLKVKVFGPTDMETVVTELARTSAPGEPVVFIPFTCNLAPSGNETISITGARTGDLRASFRQT